MKKATIPTTTKPAAKAKAARKASKQPADADPATGPDASHTRVETIKDVDAITARDDASAEAREAGSMRVVILTDAGNWGAARKGLAAWDATKTPGAGSQSGGACSPLVMLYTPATESPDVETLLKRLAKEKRSFLDLGVVASGGVHDIAPSNRSVRERWNAAHPGKAVAVKGGSK